MTTTRTPRAWPRLLFAFAALFTLATAAAQVELRMTWYDDGSEDRSSATCSTASRRRTPTSGS